MIESCVADASVVISALTEQSPQGRTLLARLSNAEVHAPHLVDAEVGNVLRRKVAAGHVDVEVAATALAELDELVEARYAHQGWLTQHAWRLRANLTFYDALYVALAARLEVPLLTADVTLSGAPGLPCAVEVV